LTARALVTGAGGFVGRRLCQTLVEREWRVTAGYRLSGSRPQIPGVSGECLPLSSEPDSWQRALRSIDCVVHLAAHVHQMTNRGGSDSLHERINVAGSRFVAEQSARAGVRRLVFLSSAKVNGEGDDARSYRAEDPPHPADAYARSKLAAETAIRDICGRTGMEFVIIRPPLVYGPGVRANFRRLLRLTELGWVLPFASIDNRRSLVAVDNLADFVQTCMVHAQAAGRVWLIADGVDLSTPDLIRRLANLMGRRARLFRCPPAVLKAAASLVGRGAEMERLCDSLVLDASPAGEILHWKPLVSVDEGLSRTVVDYVSRQRS
jgi:UDP-glucose 4-epimerase